MKDFNFIQKIILQNPESFLFKLYDSKIFSFHEFEEREEVYDDFRIHYYNHEDTKTPPKNYFKATIYSSNLDQVKELLKNNYEAIWSIYTKYEVFVPTKYLEKLLDDSFICDNINSINYYRLRNGLSPTWSPEILRKFKNNGCLSEFFEHLSRH